MAQTGPTSSRLKSQNDKRTFQVRLVMMHQQVADASSSIPVMMIMWRANYFSLYAAELYYVASKLIMLVKVENQMFR